MRLTLSDGTTLDASLLTVTSRASSRRHENAPSKRQVKQLAGTMKRHNTSSPDGGYKDDVTAIAQPADAPLCYVRTTSPVSKRDQRIFKLRPAAGRFTTNLGGSTYTGYRGGRGI
jgi:hypothetical protein